MSGMEGVDGMANYSKEELQKMLQEIEEQEKEEGKYIESQGGTYSKKILNRLFLGFIIFVIAILVIFVRVGSEPTVLVGAVIAFLSVEVWQLARIKIAESKEDIDEC